MSSTRPITPIDLSNIYEKNVRYVWRLLARFGVPERDREDVTHDTFVVVQRRLRDFDTTRPLRPWLAGVTFRVAAAYRRRKMQGEVPSELPEIASTDNVEERAVASQRHRAAMALLEQLPIERRGVFVLHELEGLSAPEISQALSIPLNTVYSRLRVARQEVRTLAAKMREES